MKILKQGKKPEERVIKASCNNCHTQIEFEQNEAEYVNDQSDGDFLRISCPLCQKDINVNFRNRN